MPYDIEATVKSVKGKCSFGCKVGDKIQFDGRTVKGAMCYSALMTILPKSTPCATAQNSHGQKTKT